VGVGGAKELTQDRDTHILVMKQINITCFQNLFFFLTTKSSGNGKPNFNKEIHFEDKC